ncbi:MAG: hypothetical protein ACI9FU_000410 [Granulosicoccus sp.]|jgi:hypothetical protein
MLKQTLSILLIASSLMVSAQTAFEGTIRLETTTARTQETSDVVMHVKDWNTRLDIHSETPGHSGDYSIIVDEKGADLLAKGEVTPLDLNTIIPPKGNMLPTLKEGNVTKNGHICTHYRFSDGEQIIDYWMSDGFGYSIEQMPAILQQGLPKPENGKLTGVPVEMKVVDKAGNIVSTQYLVSVTPGKVDDSIFNRK